jgi:AcrR family transcriptional regulator
MSKDHSMEAVANKIDRLNRDDWRDDWINGALGLLSTAGVDGVRIFHLAERLGVTSGSFYWHFKTRRELYDALVDYWERKLTDAANKATQRRKQLRLKYEILMNQ